MRLGDLNKKDNNPNYEQIPRNINTGEALDRWNKFGKMLQISQELILLMYDTREAFANTAYSIRPKNIEKIVFLYDELLGDRSMPGILANEAGIFVGLFSTDMHHFIYAKLYNYINTASSQTPTSTEKVQVLSFDDSIGYNKDQWEEYTHKNFPGEDIAWKTRSDFVMQMFYNIDRS